MSLATPEKIRTLQRKLYRQAKAEPAFRFYLLYDQICRDDLLEHAYALARTDGGAPGVDGESCAAIEAAGLAAWRAGIRQDLVAKTYRPAPVRRVMSPKPGGGARPLGLPTIRDRVVQTAAKLVLEPVPRVRPGPARGQASRRISTLRPMAIGRAGAGPTRSRRCMPCCAEASPMWWTPICRSMSPRSRIAS